MKMPSARPPVVTTLNVIEPRGIDNSPGPTYIGHMEVPMKKVLAFLALVLLIASFAEAQDWFKGSLDQAVAKAKSENKRVLLDFFSGG